MIRRKIIEQGLVRLAWSAARSLDVSVESEYVVSLTLFAIMQLNECWRSFVIGICQSGYESRIRKTHDFAGEGRKFGSRCVSRAWRCAGDFFLDSEMNSINLNTDITVG